LRALLLAPAAQALGQQRAARQAHAVEHGPPGARDRQQHGAPVAGVAGAGDEAESLEALRLWRQRGAVHAEDPGQIAEPHRAGLIQPGQQAGVAARQVDLHAPHGVAICVVAHRPGHDVLERALEVGDAVAAAASPSPHRPLLGPGESIAQNRAAREKSRRNTLYCTWVSGSKGLQLVRQTKTITGSTRECDA
jgi:hypothetical protein